MFKSQSQNYQTWMTLLRFTTIKHFHNTKKFVLNTILEKHLALHGMGTLGELIKPIIFYTGCNIFWLKTTFGFNIFNRFGWRSFNFSDHYAYGSHL